MSTAVGTEVFHYFAETARTELLVIEKDHHPAGFLRRGALEPDEYRLAQGL